jgi:hypothetical protein
MINYIRLASPETKNIWIMLKKRECWNQFVSFSCQNDIKYDTHFAKFEGDVNDDSSSSFNSAKIILEEQIANSNEVS